MNKLQTDLRGTNNKDGEPISFWVGLVDAMLQKLIDANNAVQAAGLPTATAAEKSAAKTGSYLITICKLQVGIVCVMAAWGQRYNLHLRDADDLILWSYLFSGVAQVPYQTALRPAAPKTQ